MSIISTRRHEIIEARERQLRLNELAVHGGRPYVAARLWRAPNETDVSWEGDPARGVAGRRERACLVNDAGRIARKIEQYIFRSPARRDGADEAFCADCTGTGEGIHEFMRGVCTSLTYGGWCWVQVDRAPFAVGEDGARVEPTLAERTPVRLVRWDAVDVPDWRLDADGAISWLVTRSTVYDNSDPRAAARRGVVTTLYERVDGRVYVTEETTLASLAASCRTREELPGLDRVPFVLVGRPSIRAWWFDDVENIQAQSLNLASSHNETLTDSVYPQIVLPLSLLSSLESQLREEGVNGERVVALVRELTIGRRTPIIESGEDKGVSRYIAPGGDLRLITEEIGRLRSLLFDSSGLALMNRETRQVQSAESKQFDQLDTSATLGNRALVLQDAERRIVALARLFDPNFPDYEPVYPCKFDVVDVPALSQAVTTVLNLPDVPPLMRKATMRSAARILKELGAVSEDEMEEIDEEIGEMADAPDGARGLAPNPFGDEGVGDGGDGE